MVSKNHEIDTGNTVLTRRDATERRFPTFTTNVTYHLSQIVQKYGVREFNSTRKRLIKGGAEECIQNVQEDAECICLLATKLHGGDAGNTNLIHDLFINYTSIQWIDTTPLSDITMHICEVDA